VCTINKHEHLDEYNFILGVLAPVQPQLIQIASFDFFNFLIFVILLLFFPFFDIYDIYCPKLTRKFCATIRASEEKPRNSKSLPECAEKKRAFEILDSLACANESAHGKYVTIIRGWYGTNTGNVHPILGNGFPVVDGHGIYFSAHPEYLFILRKF
jgi:hypothetical protein